MNKILLIIQREYITKVRKRSFIVMTILGPILMASLFILPIYLATRQSDKQLINVLDETGLFAGRFENSENYTFVTANGSLDQTKDTLMKHGNYMLLYVPATKLNVPENAVIYSDKQPTLNLKSYISGVMSREVEKQKLGAELRKEIMKTSGNVAVSDTAASDLLSENILKNIQTEVQITSIKTNEDGGEEKSYTEVSMVVGLVASIMIYMFIFMFGTQVMRGVIEEKTNRIVEVIVSSVKPFQLMMGKIIGVALVGLTQFLLWIVFTFLIITAVQTAFPDKFKASPVEQAKLTNSSVALPNETAPASPNSVKAETGNENVNEIFDAISSINMPVMIISFLLYFLFGYLMYAALFAAIGSAVDNETDTQQFMLPITVPLIFALVVAQSVIQNPESSLAMWLSMIPLTSPVIMMVRIPFGVPIYEIALSLGLLVLTFLFTTWLAGKIYRTGILMYGKKSSWAELWKWIRYRG